MKDTSILKSKSKLNKANNEGMTLKEIRARSLGEGYKNHENTKINKVEIKLNVQSRDSCLKGHGRRAVNYIRR